MGTGKDMAEGACCSICTGYFKKKYSYPVLCHGCWDNEWQNDRVHRHVEQTKVFTSKTKKQIDSYNDTYWIHEDGYQRANEK